MTESRGWRQLIKLIVLLRVPKGRKKKREHSLPTSEFSKGIYHYSIVETLKG